MDDFRPVTKRGTADSRWDVLHEGMPAWLLAPTRDWLALFLWSDHDPLGREYTNDFVKTCHLRLRLDLHWDRARDPSDGLLAAMRADEDLALDVIDLALRFLPQTRFYADEVARQLNLILADGGSSWEAVPVADEARAWCLTRRETTPVRQVIDELRTAGRPYDHLLAAHRKLVERHPDPSGAYREAVRAVEAAAKPHVEPNNATATLGTMIGAIRANTAGWRTTIGEPSDVLLMLTRLWKSQFDRHGTDDEQVPLVVSLAEADAAFSLALALVRLMAGGHFRRVP